MRVWLCFFFAACGGSRYQWPEFRVAQTPTAEHSAGLNAIVLLASDTMTFSVRGGDVTAKLARYRRVKVFTPEGVRTAQVSLPFSARMQLVSFDARIHVAQPAGEDRIVRWGGEEIEVKHPLADLGVKEVGEAVYRIGEVPPGGVFEYIANYDIPDGLLVEPIMLRDRLPAERSEVVIITPKGADFDLRYLSGGASKPVSPMPATPPNPAEQVAYRFVETNMPPLIAEEYGPALCRTGPAVWPVYRGMNGGGGRRLERWEDVGQWVRERYHLAPMLGEVADPEKKDPEKLQAVFSASALQMHVSDHGLRFGDQAGKPVEDRLGAGLVMYDTLASRGFKVGLGLVTRETAGLVLPEVPSPAMVDAVVVALASGGKTIYLDPSCPSCPLDQVSQPLEGAPVVALFPDGSRVETLPVREPKDNAYSITLSSRIANRGEVSGTAQVVLSGAPAAVARGAYLQKELKEVAHALGFNEHVEMKDPQSPEGVAANLTFELAFDYKAQCKEEPGARLRCGVANVLDKALPELWREARTQELIVPATFQHQLVATYQIPSKARVEVPAAMSAKSKFGEYSLTYHTAPGQLSLSRRFVLTARRVSADEYEELYKFLQQARQFDAVMPLLDLFPSEDSAPPAAQDSEKPEKKPAKKKKKKH